MVKYSGAVELPIYEFLLASNSNYMVYLLHAVEKSPLCLNYHWVTPPPPHTHTHAHPSTLTLGRFLSKYDLSFPVLDG